MEVIKLFWWKHPGKEGSYPAAQVHRLAYAERKDKDSIPTCVEDYEIKVDSLPGLTVEEIDGI